MKRVFVLGIDGIAHSFLKQLVDAKELTHLAALAAQSDFRQVDSVHPTVSSTAWTSFITGKQPGKHGLYGFVDRKAGTWDTIVPLADSIRAKNIWQVLSDTAGPVFGMNVPVTYPPCEVKGVLIADFLCPNLDKVAVSPEVRLFLKSINYEIDSDPSLGRKSPDRMLRNLNVTLDRRMEAMFHFLPREEWSYFHTHVMETDRLNHFFLARYLAGDSRYAGEYMAFLRKLDGYVGKLVAAMPRDAALVVLSDHGFCPIKFEVQLSRYLVEKKWTALTSAEPLHPLDIDTSKSKAYSLIPGRVYVNLAGREPGGIVPVADYDRTRAALTADLLALHAPNGDKVIEKVLRREEIYWPDGAKGPDPKMAKDQLLKSGRAFAAAPDLIAVPVDGYDLKMGLGASETFIKTQLEGMHVYGDAMIMSRGVELPKERFSIFNVTRNILKTMGVEPPEDMD